jgi:hypothetical protein
VCRRTIVTNDSKTVRLKDLKLTIVGRRCVAPNRGSVSTGKINSLYRVSLLVMDSVESRTRRGKSLIKVPVALCITERKCFLKRSLESSTMPRYLICGLQGMAVY